MITPKRFTIRRYKDGRGVFFKNSTIPLIYDNMDRENSIEFSNGAFLFTIPQLRDLCHILAFWYKKGALPNNLDAYCHIQMWWATSDEQANLILAHGAKADGMELFRVSDENLCVGNKFVLYRDEVFDIINLLDYRMIHGEFAAAYMNGDSAQWMTHNVA
jgi:hypothetical protein